MPRTIPLIAVLGCTLVAAAAGFAVAQPPITPHEYDLESSYLRWPLPAGAEQYGRIDGGELKQWVVDMAAISRRSRDAGNQYWGRIAGLDSDLQTEDWIENEFERVGLEDIERQGFELAPQWIPTAWSVEVSGADGTTTLASAHPGQDSAATPAGGLTLDPIWVGLGQEADFLGRDVRGKAVFIHSTPRPSGLRHTAETYGATERAAERGAAAVFVVLALPGNFQVQLNTALVDGRLSRLSLGSDVPIFSIGLDDGNHVREAIEAGHPVSIDLRLSTEIRDGLECASVWGTLPGMTDETIIVMAHHDAYFEGALDNASGTAAMLGLAKYFAGLPRTERRRTLRFVSTAAHHAGAPGALWMHDNRDTFLSDTALVLNAEHISVTQTYLYGPALRKSNTTDARRWWVFGSDTLASRVLESYQLFGVAVYHEMEPIASGDMRDVSLDAPSVQVVESPWVYHSDHDTPEYVPAAGLEAMTRAYAHIIDQVNELEIEELRAPASLTNSGSR